MIVVEEVELSKKEEKIQLLCSEASKNVNKLAGALMDISDLFETREFATASRLLGQCEETICSIQRMANIMEIEIS